MTDYVFRLLNADGGTVALRTLALGRDVDACVRSFDLLRDNPRVASISVTCGERAVLVRRRCGGKSVVTRRP